MMHNIATLFENFASMELTIKWAKNRVDHEGLYNAIEIDQAWLQAYIEDNYAVSYTDV